MTRKKLNAEEVVETSEVVETPVSKLLKHTGTISIKPFIDPNRENMGLENYGLILFPGTYHEEQLVALENKSGVVRFITGLDEFAPEVQKMENQEAKAAKIRKIREIVAYLEKIWEYNIIDVDDPAFWSKVKRVKPNNYEFWSHISIRCGNDPVILDPANEPFDLIKLMAIEAGGFSIVARSYEDAVAQSTPPLFYLDKEVLTVSAKTTYKKLRNKAIGFLDKLYDKNRDALLFVTKVLAIQSARYTYNTPSDLLYDACDEYINGEGGESNKTKAAERFIEIANLDFETLKIRAMVKDATFFKFITIKADGLLYHTKTSSMMGRNVSDVVEYLKDPLNEEIAIKLLEEVEEYWYQN